MGWGRCEISFCVCRRGVDRVYLRVLLKYLSCLLLTIFIGYIFDDVFLTIYICTNNLFLLFDNTTGMTHLKIQKYSALVRLQT